ncbi:xylosidase : arabinofuranosidase [Diaporthe sp. PMI_573]|nr:xylosidase : arabinofuranosidase [Diaporthaceae sp. PMI_573]
MLLTTLLTSLLGVSSVARAQENSFTNPILPGWHSDPSCTGVIAELNNTNFCVASTFLATPGLPIYASQDFVNWKLVSSALTRESQLPELADSSPGQQNGIFAPTFRYRNGTFYIVVVSVLGVDPDQSIVGTIYTTSDPYSDDAWSEALRFTPASIDPDLFWDDDVDGQVYITFAGIQQAKIDLSTGEVGSTYYIWNGTGGSSPEGPHIYKPWKDGYYYLLIAEGGTELNHAVTIARAPSVDGPYEAFEGNPILTNRNTTEYFQTVGHADLWQDADGNWWGVALSTRSGPEWLNYPMGRESVLFNATWEEGEWPICQNPIQGRMTGWDLPTPSGDIPGDGPLVSDSDVVDFEDLTSMPKQFLYWRFPKTENYEVSPEEKPTALKLVPSVANLTGGADFEPADGITFVSRRQTYTTFNYSVDVELNATTAEEEVGVTAFLTQYQHIDLGLVALNTTAGLDYYLRFRVTGTGNYDGPTIETVVKPLPTAWSQPVRLGVQAVNDTHYALSAAPSDESANADIIGYAPSTLLSGGTGPFTGTLIGAYATSNGGTGSSPAYVSRWRYQGVEQKIE